MRESENKEDPLKIIPGSTLILKPVNGEGGSVPLILVPTSEASGSRQRNLHVSQSRKTRPQTQSELPRPNWSRMRFVEKIQLMKSPSAYDIHNSTPIEPLQDPKPSRKRSKISKLIVPDVSDLEDLPDEDLEEKDPFEPIVHLSPGFSIADVETNSAMSYYYTGFASHDHLKDLFTRLHLEEERAEVSLLSPEMEFLLTIIKLRTNKDFEELGFFFNVDKIKAREIFNHWILCLYFSILKSVFWVHPTYINAALRKRPKILSCFYTDTLRKKMEDEPPPKKPKESLGQLLPIVQLYGILNHDPEDENMKAIAMEIINVCFGIANFHLYPDFLLLLSTTS
eukprot:TRINITY_DN4333_c0_g1_i1.p1 TRINITY_DN4333_c0_g1~~TRINITY_DN4333_c0_g1_i1.p1  ORF type:complete len:339 (-),score=101.20 TRINITY_DN4333_c0_g1_i1:241-1257(-)